MSRDAASELQGSAARQMIAEDARWSMDVILSSRKSTVAEGYFPLILGHHWVRIAHEGARALRSHNAHVGVPLLADLLQEKYAAITAQARHSAKVLDDTKRSYEDVLINFAGLLTAHRQQLSGGRSWWTRRSVNDLGLYYCQKRLIGATILAAYRLGLDITRLDEISGQDMLAVTEEWGGTLAVLGSAAMDGSEPVATLDFASSCTIDYADRIASRYLSRRFETTFPVSLKALLLLIEGDLNTAITVLPQTAEGHQQPVFRARTISLYHSLTALRQISDRYADQDTAGLQGLRALLADTPTQRLLSRQGKSIRNRCMHYSMNDPQIRIDANLPMFGIIESVDPTSTWDSFNADVTTVTLRVAEHMSAWRPAKRRITLKAARLKAGTSATDASG